MRLFTHKTDGVRSRDVGAALALSIAELSRMFGGLRALDNVSISVKHGERVGVIGPNGAGKTTLFRTICGEVAPTSGRIEIFGRDVTKKSVIARARYGLGRTFQITNLLRRLTVRQNLTLALQRPGRIAIAMDRSDGRSTEGSAERYWAAELGMEESIDRTVGQLGYGEQRRLELGLVLASGARLLLLDEPAAGLGVMERHRMVELIRSLSRDFTVLLVEHDLGLTINTVDRVICMNFGAVAADIPSADAPRSEIIRRVYLGA